MQLFTKYCLRSLFAECCSEHQNHQNYTNLAAGLPIGIYEIEQIHTRIGSRPIGFQHSESGTHINRLAYERLIHDVKKNCCIHQSLPSHKLVFYGGFPNFELLLLVRNSTYVAQILCDLSYKL